MEIKTEQVKLVISNKALPTKQLSQIIGISQEVLDEYRAGSLSFDNLSAGVLMAIQKWIDDGNYKISYDYSELIHELKSDMAEGLTQDDIYVVRGGWNEALGTAPIIDYYYTLGNVENFGEDDTVQKMKPQTMLDEMERYNSLF